MEVMAAYAEGKGESAYVPSGVPASQHNSAAGLNADADPLSYEGCRPDQFSSLA